MRLHEFEGKVLFSEHGLSVPRGEVADSPEEAVRVAAELGGEVVVKAQVLIGGRGKAGGIRMAADAAGAGRAARHLLGTRIRGVQPQVVLVEERLAIGRELYLGVTVDNAAGQPVALVGALGGVDVEARSGAHPAAMASACLDPRAGMSAALSDNLVHEAGLQGDLASGVTEALRQLYDVFAVHEALQVEINPLAVLADGSLVAADAVVELDDVVASGQSRWSDRAATDAAAARAEMDGGMTYVEVDGDIGLI